MLSNNFGFWCEQVFKKTSAKVKRLYGVCTVSEWVCFKSMFQFDLWCLCFFFLTLNILSGVTSVKPKADYYPFFAPNAAMEMALTYFGLAWNGVVIFWLTYQSPQEETPQLLLPPPPPPLLPQELSWCQVNSHICRPACVKWGYINVLQT